MFLILYFLIKFKYKNKDSGFIIINENNLKLVKNNIKKIIY